MYKLLISFCLTAMVCGCMPSPHTHTQAKETTKKEWTPPDRCKTMDTRKTNDFIVSVQHNCLKEDVVTLTILFLNPYKKEMAEEVAKTVHDMLGKVTLGLLTSGKIKNKPFFLFVVMP